MAAFSAPPERSSSMAEQVTDGAMRSEKGGGVTLPTTDVRAEIFRSTASKPDGFEDVLTVYFGGDPFGCMGDAAVEDSVYFEGSGVTAEIEVGYRVHVCPPPSVGDVSEDDWEVVGPDGNPVRTPLSNTELGWDWFAQPGDPPGEYRFTLPAHPQVGEAVLTLKLASRPGIFLFPPADANLTALVHCHAGSVKGAVIGLVGEEHADVHIYTQSAPATMEEFVPFAYQTSFPVDIDPASGQGLFELDLGQSDSTLNYGLTLAGTGESIFENGGALLCQDGWP